MSRVVSMRLRDGQVARLARIARRLGRTPSETAVVLLEEALREAEYASILFRDSAVGRQAYVEGTSLAVWEVVLIARSYEGDAERTAEHLQWPVRRVQAALNYAADFPEEIEAALEDNDAWDFAAIRRAIPNAEELVLDAASAEPSTR